jgi:hypothetical protein
VVRGAPPEHLRHAPDGCAFAPSRGESGLGHDQPVTPAPDEVDRRRVRIGLGIVAAMFLVALVLLLVIDDPTGRALMAAVLLIAVIRAALVMRALRKERG